MIHWTELTYRNRKGELSPWTELEGFSEPSTTIRLRRIDIHEDVFTQRAHTPCWRWKARLEDVEAMLDGGDLTPDEAKAAAVPALLRVLRRMTAELEAL